MRLSKILLLNMFVILVLSACQMNFTGEQSGSSTSLPVRDTIIKSPLEISYYGYRDEDSFRIALLAKNTDESVISADDYQYQWPRFIEDEHAEQYKVSNVELRQSTLFDRELSPHELGIEMTIEPPPRDTDTVYFSIPFYMVPSIYEDGYRFQLNESQLDRRQLGDMRVENLELDGSMLTFDLIDDHPAADGTEEYLFTAIQEDQEIFPMFISMRRSRPETHIEVEFASSITLPTRLSIIRTTSPLPEWRFSMIIRLRDFAEDQSEDNEEGDQE